MPSPLSEDALISLAPHCRVIRTPPREIYLITDTDELRLEGELFCDLAAHLDGSLTVAEIAERMVNEGTATADEVPAAVGIMRERGFVVDSRDHADPAGLFALWWGLENHEQTRGTVIRVVSVGQTPVAQLRTALAEHGLVPGDLDQPESDTPRCDTPRCDTPRCDTPRSDTPRSDTGWTVVLADDYLNPDLPVILGEIDTPVLLASLAGARPTIGPWLGAPGPCIECLTTRLVFNRQVEKRLHTAGDRMGPVALGWTPGTAMHGATEVALAIKRRIVGQPEVTAHPDPSVAQMTVIDHITGERVVHHVVRRPQCRQCGTPLSLEDSRHRITLQSGALDAKDDGSYRRLTPQQTLATFGHHVSPRTGVVEQLRRTTDHASVIHVVESGINLATVRKGAKAGGFRQSAGGKGTTADQASAGALAEAIERFSATHSGEEPTLVASLDDLGDDGIDPRTITLFSARQYADQEHWNQTHKPMHKVPTEFEPSVQMEWSPAWSLTRDRRVWLPTPSAYYIYGGNYAKNGCAADSNGNAAGTSLEDAILQGFFELVERDAVATWWYNRIQRPAADLQAYGTHFGEPYIAQVQEHYARKLDRDVWVLDVTSDLGIPTFVAVSQARSGKPRVLLGFGAHRDARGALLRAITEMNQMLGMISALEVVEPDSSVRAGVSPEIAWWNEASMESHPYVLPHGNPVGPLAHAHNWGTDGKENVKRAQALVEGEGMEMYVMNMTHPDIRMPVVKVMVPGMRHFWPRYAPGRLYDVPVTMGWRSSPLAEDALNSTPIFW